MSISVLEIKFSTEYCSLNLKSGNESTFRYSLMPHPSGEYWPNLCRIENSGDFKQFLVKYIKHRPAKVSVSKRVHRKTVLYPEAQLMFQVPLPHSIFYTTGRHSTMLSE